MIRSDWAGCFSTLAVSAGYSGNNHTDAELLEALLDGCSRGLASFLRARPLARAVSHRLAFRELGLAIGLKAVAAIAYEIKQRSFDNRVALRRATDWLLRHESLGAEIIDDWLLICTPAG